MVGIKAILYAIILPFVIFVMDGLDLNKIFKQSRVFQARMMYLILAISFTYLVSNFLYEFFISCKII